MLLVAAWRRLLVAGVALAGLWTAVLWVAPSTPSTAPAQPSLRVAAQPTAVPVSETGALRAVVRDRKSTRLNSSHGSISYAVFCLKKKTKQAGEVFDRLAGRTGPYKKYAPC